MTLPICHYQIVTFLQLPICHYQIVTFVSLPNCHYQIVTLTNCHYQIVITKWTLPKIRPSKSMDNIKEGNFPDSHPVVSTVTWQKQGSLSCFDLDTTLSVKHGSKAQFGTSLVPIVYIFTSVSMFLIMLLPRHSTWVRYRPKAKIGTSQVTTL